MSTSTEHRPAQPPARPGAVGTPEAPATLSGAARTSKRYYDARGRLQTAAKPVPINQFGQIVGVEYRCRRCRKSGWYPTVLKGIPVCDDCNLRMKEVPLRRAPLLPWRELWKAAERPLRSVWALPAMAAGGYAVHAAPIPALVVVGAAPVAGELARRVTQRRMVKAKQERGRLEADDPDGDKRLRAAIARQARMVGYGTGAGVGWLALAAGLGVDPSTTAGRVALASLGALWLAPAATWWRKVRPERKRPQPPSEPEVAVDGPPPLDPDEAQCHRIWDTILAVQAGQVIGYSADGVTPIKAKAAGKLPGTYLEDWYRLPGGWGATIVGPIGVYESDQYTAAIGKIASAFSVRKTMVTVMPDPEDENRAMLMIQRSSPLKEVVPWAGPDSIDVERGIAPMCMYADSTPVMYELYRPGWGSPHDFLCGTTGAGKSEALSTLLLIDRWAHYTDEHGVKHGLVADLLIDPQQGQSYEPFMDDLAAPVATSIEEAMLVVEAFRREMLRRNAYLSKKGWRDREGTVHRAEWVDAKGRTRHGRKWWNPLVDGPILTLNIDEAHEFLAVKAFAALVTAGARMYRKCGMRVRVVTHTPLLGDLGGSMALRSMLTGGFVWVGRTADRLSGPTAFNGRLPADPCSLPLDPGTCFVLGGAASKPMLARAMWEPDYYDWVRDSDGAPIGYPAPLPAQTVEAFGPEFARWVHARANDEDWAPQPLSEQAAAARTEPPSRAVDSVLSILAAQSQPVDMDELDALLRRNNWEYSTRTVRDALKKLRDAGQVLSSGGRHELTPQAREDIGAQRAESLEAAGS